jgi:tetraacyldisaccharide 4'-kinase
MSGGQVGVANVERIGDVSRRRADGIWMAPSSDPIVMLLRPLSAAFGAIVRVRRSAYENGWLPTHRVDIPAISVGNLTVGGAGKTPFTRWLTEQLAQRGQRPAILHGGYAPDEPALHRAWQPQVPVYTGRNRNVSARAATDEGATVLVLDDGRQHLRLARDLDIVLIAADSWDQPRRLLPAGGWREQPRSLKAGDAIVITRKTATRADAHVVAQALETETGHAPLASAAIELADWTDLNGSPASAPRAATVVCGVADPQAFAGQIQALGIRVLRVLAFGDHHDYTRDDLRQIVERAEGSRIVITEKDAVKIRVIDEAFPAQVVTQKVVIEWGIEALWSAIGRVVR